MKFCSSVRDVFREVWSRALMLVLLSSVSGYAELDPAFYPNITGLVSTVAVQADGRILIGGNFSAVNGSARSFLARLNPDGSLDGSFAPSNGPSQYVSRVSIVNSKIYVSAGDGLRCFDLNGALEWSYPMSVATFAVDSQERVVLGGQFTRIENQPHRNIARLTAAGALDATFTNAIGCCAGDSVAALATAGDSVLVGGGFHSVNGSSVNNFARLDANGSLDLNFVSTADPLVLALVPTANGNIFRASEYTLARHLADGALDPSFTAVNADGISVERFLALAAQADGKAIVGGAPSFIARFNSDGSRDSSLTAQPDGVVQSIAVQSNGDVLIAGSFSHVDGQPRTGLARLTTSSSGAVELAVTRSGEAILLSWPAAFADYTLQSCELNSSEWLSVSNAPVLASGRHWVTNTATASGALFRLARVP